MKIKSKYPKALEQLGIHSSKKEIEIVLTSAKYPGIFPGWKALSAHEYTDKVDAVFRFSRCLYEGGKEFLVVRFGSLTSGDPNMTVELDEHLRANGYEVHYGEAPMGTGLGVMYIKGGEKRFGMEFDVLRHNQLRFWLRLSRFRSIWDHADGLTAQGRQFLFSITKQCDDCG